MFELLPVKLEAKTLISMFLCSMFRSSSKVLRPEKLAPHLFEVDEDVEKDEVSLRVTNFIREHSLSFCVCL